MAKKAKLEDRIPEPLAITPEPREVFVQEVIKPYVEDHLITQIKNLRERGFDNNRIAATLMIHKHLVDSI